MVDDSLAVDSFQSYAPYGEELDTGPFGSPFTFTGEMSDANGLLYLRARYYSPALGVFASLDPVEGALRQAMSLNRYSWVQGNVINMVDRNGGRPCEPFGCEEEEIFFGELESLNSTLLDRGAHLIQQNPCTGPFFSPFGCDEQGNPIPYFLIQDFLNSPYPGSTLCGSGGSFYSDKHCGIDIVSYSDISWLWVNYGDNRQIVRLQTLDGDFLFDRRTGRITADIMGRPTNADPRVTREMMREAKFQYEGFPVPVQNNSPKGRKVFSISDGEVLGWFSNDSTLVIKVNDTLEIQYTHLADPPKVTSGTIVRGEEIGYYGNFGATDNPHLHITYKSRLGVSICPGPDVPVPTPPEFPIVFENPLHSLTTRFWVPTALRQPPLHIRSGRACQRNGTWSVNHTNPVTPNWFGGCTS